MKKMKKMKDITPKEVKLYEEELKELYKTRDIHQTNLKEFNAKITDTLQRFRSKCLHKSVKDNNYFGTFTCTICGEFLFE